MSSKLSVNKEMLRNDPTVNYILNTFNQPSLEWSLGEIFSFNGLKINENYYIKAQPYNQVFVIHLYKYFRNELLITFTVKDVLDQTWRNNVKLSEKIKYVLDKIYEKYVYPYKETWDNFLINKTSKRPLVYNGYIVKGTQRVKPIVYVKCPLNNKEKPIDQCIKSCEHFIRETNNGIECRNITKLKV